jgi:hypothetical protein
MVERKDQSQLTVKIGEEFSPLVISGEKVAGLEFILEGVGIGEVDLVPLEPEDSVYVVRNLKKDRLNYIAEIDGKIAVDNIPQHLAEFNVVIDLNENVENTPHHLVCKMKVGSLELKSVVQEMTAQTNVFDEWENNEVYPNTLLIHLDPTILSQIKISFSWE